MIPRLNAETAADLPVAGFLRALRAEGFRGRIDQTLAGRLVASVDNSIYQHVPGAVVHPAGENDVVRIARLLGDDAHRAVRVMPRGGGTGTNAQSLGTGIAVDVSRTMDEILEIDPGRRIARVQPGVVLASLNAAAAEFGLMFGPSLSTADRATLGGMISTDAAGKGSRVYGKTSDHVLGLRVALVGGEVLETRAMDEAALGAAAREPGLAGRVHGVVRDEIDRSIDAIRRDVPALPRFVTGYDLPHVRDPGAGGIDLTRLVAGAEGTLGIITEATLNLVPIPAHRTVVALAYEHFDDALADAAALVETDPHAIETMDGTLTRLAVDDPAWATLAALLERTDGSMRSDDPPGSVNLVEFAGDDADAVDRAAAAVLERARGGRLAAIAAGRADDGVVRSELWALRSRAVGTVARLPGSRAPVAFVEDCAVPPTELASFVRGFRRILEGAGLPYAMYGHVDAGVIHVRPALDLVDPDDRALVAPITEAVVQLALDHRGVLWGEHGKGVRGAYNETFMGSAVVHAMARIKAVFDPHDQLNPGKIVAPAGSGHALLTIEGAVRGQRDRQIDRDLARSMDDAIRCNGNGVCHSVEPEMVMCPSDRATRDRLHSPKGRATVLREWLRRLSLMGVESLDGAGPSNAAGTTWPGRLLRSLGRRLGQPDFSHEVHTAMDGCLACKACATQCPLHVDVADLRSRFLAAYHTRYARPVSDPLVAGVETLLPLAARAARLANVLGHTPPAPWVVARLTGLVDPPWLDPRPLHRRSDLPCRRLDPDDPGPLASLEKTERDRHVVLLPDVFHAALHGDPAAAAIRVLDRLGLTVHLAPALPSGKPLHVKGYLGGFERTARRTAAILRRIGATGVPIVGVDPAIAITFRDEHVSALPPDERPPTVHLLGEWLAADADRLERLSSLHTAAARSRPAAPPPPPHLLLGHCTERALAPASIDGWRRILAAVGIEARQGAVGCCGMCGAWGHERRHAAISRGIWERTWRPAIETAEGPALVTGYSCWSQSERCGDLDLLHPVQVVAERIDGG